LDLLAWCARGKAEVEAVERLEHREPSDADRASRGRARHAFRSVRRITSRNSTNEAGFCRGVLNYRVKIGHRAQPQLAAEFRQALLL
jgi:hypothetical protein